MESELCSTEYIIQDVCIYILMFIELCYISEILQTYFLSELDNIFNGNVKFRTVYDVMNMVISFDIF